MWIFKFSYSMWKIPWFRMKYEILRAQSLGIQASTFQLRSLKPLVCLKSGTVYKSGGGVWDVSLFSGTSGWKFVFQNIVLYSSLSKMTLVIPAFFQGTSAQCFKAGCAEVAGDVDSAGIFLMNFSTRKKIMLHRIVTAFPVECPQQKNVQPDG